jgi:hypothetical protein
MSSLNNYGRTASDRLERVLPDAVALPAQVKVYLASQNPHTCSPLNEVYTQYVEEQGCWRVDHWYWLGPYGIADHDILQDGIDSIRDEMFWRGNHCFDSPVLVSTFAEYDMTGVEVRRVSFTSLSDFVPYVVSRAIGMDHPDLSFMRVSYTVGNA